MDTSRHSRALFWLLLIVDTCPLVVLLALYRYAPVQTFPEFLVSPAGLLAIIAGATSIFAGVRLARLLRGPSRETRRTTTLMFAMNLIAVLGVVIVGELSLRGLHEMQMRYPSWPQNYATLRSWEQTAQSFRHALHRGSTMGTFHDFDPLLGWRIGASRSSPDGLYASSVEGLRSDRPGVSLLGTATLTSSLPSRHRKPSRVALLGDSFTFGYEVSYEDSWARQMAAQLGPSFSVLNFGVIGYGVNQSRLKYARDVRPLHPDVVVLSVISHDFERDAAIYNFFPFPGQLNLPYPRPRPVLRKGQLELLNVPLPTPEEIFAARSVHDLPYLEYDVNYNWLEWTRSPWRLLQRSFFFRTLAAWPSGPPTSRRARFEEEKVRIETRVLQSLAAQVAADGAIPMFVYFPEAREMEMPSDGRGHRIPQAIHMLEAADLQFLDMTECIRRVPSHLRYAPLGHFSQDSNAAIADCLAPLILERLDSGPTSFHDL